MGQRVRYLVAAALLGAIAGGSTSIGRLHAQSSAAEALKKARVLERLADEWTPNLEDGTGAEFCRRSRLAETAAEQLDHWRCWRPHR